MREKLLANLRGISRDHPVDKFVSKINAALMMENISALLFIFNHVFHGVKGRLIVTEVS